MVTKNKIVVTTLTLLIGFTALAQTERGKASYYAKSWTGHKTADGSRLHHDSLTCAHKTYPFGTLLKVTNPANGLSVIVKVTDRGPYVKGRIVDLSVRAAEELGMLAQGIAPVIVERYNQATIPFKPEDIELPELDFGANDGPTNKPIWMELRDQRKKRQEEKNAPERKLAQNQTDAPPQENTPAEELSSTPHQAEGPSTTSSKDDELDEISNMPNHSKAYLKRSGNGKTTTSRR